MSTFGYHNFSEIDSRLTGLKSAGFPLDGFVLDLYWYGGIKANDPNTQIGTLTWDPANFPNPVEKLADYKTNNGIGIILIEESLVGKNLTSWADLNSKGFLVRDGCSTCAATLIDHDTDTNDNEFFGDVGIIDWTSASGADWWFDKKRLARIRDGIFGHWLDLNEPEGGCDKNGCNPLLYHRSDWYAGFDPNVGKVGGGLHAEADVHNMFAFFQAQSIARGYTRNSLTQRPFMMSRSGAPGTQRFGITQWSADIAPHFASLATWNNVQMMMTLSGMDYYSSDLGGFRRKKCNVSDCKEGFDQLYTQWYATGMMLDVPGRPHSDDILQETSPALIGRVPSNLANTRRRYELIPTLTRWLTALGYMASLSCRHSSITTRAILTSARLGTKSSSDAICLLESSPGRMSSSATSTCPRAIG